MWMFSIGDAIDGKHQIVEVTPVSAGKTIEIAAATDQLFTVTHRCHSP
jgi:hypothetical protein